MNERLGQITSSPCRIPLAISARWRAVVQDETAIAKGEDTYSANAFSNSATFGPWLTQPLRSAATIAASSSGPKDGRATGITAGAVAIFIAPQPNFSLE